MNPNLTDNPFATLVAPLEVKAQDSDGEGKESDVTNASTSQEKISSSDALSEEESSSTLEWLLLFSTSDPPVNKVHSCLHLPDATEPLKPDTVKELLFSRLFVQNSTIVKPVRDGSLNKWSTLTDSDVVFAAKENHVVQYLWDVYRRCNEAISSLRLSKMPKQIESHYRDLIEGVRLEAMKSFCTSLSYPELFEETAQDIDKDFSDLLMDTLCSVEHMKTLVINLLQDEERNVEKIDDLFSRYLIRLISSFRKTDLFAVDFKLVNQVVFFSTVPQIACRLFNAINAQSPPNYFENECVIGSLLSVFCIPVNGPVQNFTSETLTQADVNVTRSRIKEWSNMLIEKICEIFKKLIANKDTKHLFLNWCSECLKANVGRAGSYYTSQPRPHRDSKYVSDGFMVNLGEVLMRLAANFTKDISGDGHHKILSVDPSFCCKGLSEGEGPSGWYKAGLDTVTSLISLDGEAPTLPLPTHYTFVTSCFFMGHAALNLGLSVIVERIHKVQTELDRFQRQVANLSHQERTSILKIMIAYKSLYLSYEAVILSVVNADRFQYFLGSTAYWLVQVSQCSSKSKLPTEGAPLLIPIPEVADEDLVPSGENWLLYIPEILVSNIANLSQLSKQFKMEQLQMVDMKVEQHYLTFIIAFMGSSARIKNPHLKAEMAHTLELLLFNENISRSRDSDGKFEEFLPDVESMVQLHPSATELPQSIIRVFVGIEMTGQNVEFEEKFKYRLPMYVIMTALCRIESQKKEFVSLAETALSHMESPKPPLFLRFVNLLINDNIFLLDEGLSYLQQIKEIQLEMENIEAWQAQSELTRREREGQLQHFMMFAGFHNLLGMKTSHTLAILSQMTSSLFCHKTLVERVASMLNYFLDHLVGPKQGKFKVRDMEKIGFKPSQLVTQICQVYVNLSSNAAFADAVIADDRSYSPKLLSQAKDVLSRIGQSSLASSMAELSKAVSAAASSRKEEDDLTSAAPDKYLDPLLSNLMRDPVLLPTSGNIVDRSTIARHLLSDQTDPFNRQPLDMSQVVPDTALRDEVLKWVDQQRAQRGANDQSSVEMDNS